MNKRPEKAPITFVISKWWGYIFSGFYLLYGGVSIVLTLMDSNVTKSYDDMMQSFLFLLLGIVLITVAYAFRDRKTWGWYGLVTVNVISIALLASRLADLSSLILGMLCLIVTVLLFLPETRRCVFDHT